MACQLFYRDVPFLDNLAAGRHYNLEGSMACLLLQSACQRPECQYQKQPRAGEAA